MRYGKSFHCSAGRMRGSLRFAIIGFAGVALRFASLARRFRKRLLLQDTRQLAINSRVELLRVHVGCGKRFCCALARSLAV